MSPMKKSSKFIENIECENIELDSLESWDEKFEVRINLRKMNTRVN